MMMERKIKFAVIGCGHIGKRHAEMVHRNNESELVALCDVMSANEAGVDHFNVPYFTDAKEMLSAGLDIDVVCICSPNGLHTQHALLALTEGKHIVLEKPMAITKADCEKIIFKSMQAHLQVFGVMQNRYSPPSVASRFVRIAASARLSPRTARGSELWMWHSRR